jgi:putative FmdB family regulatory protein
VAVGSPAGRDGKRFGRRTVTPVDFRALHPLTLEETLVPTYAYACTACDHAFDAVQKFSDDALTQCPECGGRLRKVYTSIGVTFKGSGFYRNDSRAGSNGNGAASEKGSDKGSDKGAEKGSDKGSDKGSEKGVGTSSEKKTDGATPTPAAASAGTGASSGSSGASTSSGSSGSSGGAAKAAR